MRSCIWYIRLHIAVSAELAQILICYELVAPTYVVNFMAYAIRADPHIESRGTQTALIDQLNNLIGEYDMNGDWLCNLSPWRKGKCKLLELSTIWGLPGYVRDRLSMIEESQLKAAATSLLQFSLSDESHALNRLPLPSLEMVSLLLRFGADAGSSCTSPQAALESANRGLENLGKRSGMSTHVLEESKLKYGQKLYTGIIEMLRGQQPVPGVGYQDPQKTS